VEEKLFSVAWVSSSIKEENIIEDWICHEIEPGKFYLRDYDFQTNKDIKLPQEWFDNFPKGDEIFRLVLDLLPKSNWKQSTDRLLLKRRELEYDIFLELEKTCVLPKIISGFKSVDAFVKYANSVTNRRKNRTGTSLELNLESIFHDEEILFERNIITENRKRPDFLFPSGKAYHNTIFPSSALHMMAVKTCCKDRWRQILNEANRINTKHLFTLQEGVSANQLQEMKDNHVKLVIAEPLKRFFPKEWRSSLITLDGFIEYIITQQIDLPKLQNG